VQRRIVTTYVLEPRVPTVGISPQADSIIPGSIEQSSPDSPGTTRSYDSGCIAALPPGSLIATFEVHVVAGGGESVHPGEWPIRTSSIRNRGK